MASPSCEPTVAAALRPFLRESVNAVRGRLFGGFYSGEGWERHTAIATPTARPRREARLGSWVARAAGIAKRIILFPMPQPISCSQASKLGHEKRRAHIREVARQICRETNQPIPEALLR